MVTMDTAPTFRELAAMKLARFATQRRERATPTNIRVNTVLNAIVRVVLHVAGFAFLTYAGFQWNMIAGLTIAGLSCFALSRLMAPEMPAPSGPPPGRAPDLRTGR